MPVSDQKYPYVDADDVECSHCCCTVFEPVYCGKCYGATCGACRAVLNKNDSKDCLKCITPFNEANPESHEVQGKLDDLKNTYYRCEATEGQKIMKCQEKDF